MQKSYFEKIEPMNAKLFQLSSVLEKEKKNHQNGALLHNVHSVQAQIYVKQDQRTTATAASTEASSV